MTLQGRTPDRTGDGGIERSHPDRFRSLNVVTVYGLKG
jgi:hypothetical protein